MTPYPWLQAVWAELTRDRQRLPHALLLQGMRGVGKHQLALALTRWLLCQQPQNGTACGACPSCNWMDQGGHPDLRIVEPLDEVREGESARRGRRLISVDDIRQATQQLDLSSHQGGWRVVLITPAEAMNTAAANALLKTLEEPPPDVLLILVSHQPRRLPATVRSRCRKLTVPKPSRQLALTWLAERGLAEAEVWLQEAGGAPMLALELAKPEQLVQRQRFLDALATPSTVDWCELAQDMQQSLNEAWGWLVRWTCDLIACQAGAAVRYFPQYADALRARAAAAHPVRLWGLYQELLQAGRWLQHPLNAQLLLESWLLRYACMEDEP